MVLPVPAEPEMRAGPPYIRPTDSRWAGWRKTVHFSRGELQRAFQLLDALDHAEPALCVRVLEGLTRNRRLSSALLNQLREHAFGRRAADGVIEDSFGGLRRKMRRYIQDVALRGLQHVIEPLDGHAPFHEACRRHLMEQEDRRRSRLDVARDDDLLHSLAYLHQLRSAGARMRLQLATLSPRVGRIVMTHIGEEQAARRPVDDQPHIAADADRPEVLVLGLVQFVELHPQRGRVHLKIKCRRLDGLRLVARQLRQAIGEGVGDSEVH